MNQLPDAISGKKDIDIDFRDGKIANKKLENILRGTTVEVKYDRRAHKTGNIFIELSCRGKPSPSGLFNTPDTWFAIIIANYGLVVLRRTEVLRTVVKTLTFQGKLVAENVEGGDDNASIGHLIKIADLVRE